MNFPLNIFRLPVIENTKCKTNDKGGQKYVTSFPNFQDHILKPYKIPIAQLTCRGGGEVPCLFQTPWFQWSSHIVSPAVSEGNSLCLLFFVLFSTERSYITEKKELQTI